MDHQFQWHTNVKEYLVSINHSSIYNRSEDDLTVYHTTSWFDSGPDVLLVILYCIVVFGGVFGNASLVITLCTQTPTRFRNPLLVALCLADLMVTGVSAPLTIVALALANQTWSLTVTSCKTIYFMQVRNLNLNFLYTDIFKLAFTLFISEVSFLGNIL